MSDLTFWKRAAILLFIVALMALMGHRDANAEGLRVELTAGTCRYGKATDGSWWKDNYPAEYDLTVPCGAVHVSSTPWGLGSYKTGWRLGFVDLGRPKATTNVPLIDAEANSFPSGADCFPHSGAGCVGKFQQTGGAYGLTASAIIERSYGKLTLGAEAGIFYYRSWWLVLGEWPAPGTCPACTDRQEFSWDHARGNHGTSLLGLTAEYQGWLLHVRRYSQVYASKTDENPGNIGLIGGALVSVNAGYQWKFQ